LTWYLLTSSGELELLTDEPFDPLLFLALARELGQSDDQTKLRTAVGRAYYAVFLVARDRLSVVAGEKTHKEVFESLKRRNQFRLRDQMMSLYKLRQIADYEMDGVDERCKDWKSNWTRQEKLADTAMTVVQTL
jgi:hypothetical protein